MGQRGRRRAAVSRRHWRSPRAGTAQSGSAASVTQARASFALRAGATVVGATAYASGLGCFALTLNGQQVADSMMDPGWSTLPPMRLLYRAYNVSHLLVPGENSAGVRLGFCHYGGIDQPFCIDGHAMRDTCRGFVMRLSVRYADGETQDVLTTAGGGGGAQWNGTTNGNPMVYTHLYHGEVFDARILQAGWDEPGFSVTTDAGWGSVLPYMSTTAYEGPNQPGLVMSLHEMPTMGVAEQLRPINVSKLELGQPAQPQAETAAPSCASQQRPKPPCPSGWWESGSVCNQGCPVDAQGRDPKSGHCLCGKAAPDSGCLVGLNCVSGQCCHGPEPPSVCKTNCVMVQVANGYYLGQFIANTPKIASIPECQAACIENSACVQITWAPSNADKCVMYTAIHKAGKDAGALGWVKCAAGSKSADKCAPFTPGPPAPGPPPPPPPPPPCLPRGTRNLTTWLFDFGQNFAGVAELSVRGLPAGTRLLVRHSEFLSPSPCGDVYPQQCAIAQASPTTEFEGGWPCAPEDICRGVGPHDTPSSCGLGNCTAAICREFDQDQGGNRGNQTTLYITSGSGAETFRPSFSYFGMRYASISGFPAGFVPTAATLTALRVNTRVKSTGHISFNTSVNILNKIQRAVQYTVLSNFHSHPEDCPQREKHGWMADSQLASAPANLNFDMETFYTNWVRTMHDQQLLGCDVPHPLSGALPAPDAVLNGLPSPDGLPPRPPWFSCQFQLAPTGNATGCTTDVTPHGGWPGGFPADPNWGIAVVTVPWEVYKRTGRIAIVHEHYDAAQQFVDFLDRNAANKSVDCPLCGETAPLYTHAVYGDWLCCADYPTACGGSTCPHESASAFAHVLATSRLVDMANLTGRLDDVRRYSELLSLLKAAYHDRYFRSDLGRYWAADASPNIQSHQVFPLYLGVVPAEHEASVVGALVEALRNESNHVNCGIVGSRFILEVLSRYGHADLALAIATNASAPGWGNMVTGHDAPGTIWESWTDGQGLGVSKNHPAFSGGIGVWLYQLAGLAEESTPSSLVLRPPRETIRAVGSAQLETHTPFGRVGFGWRYTPTTEGFEANVSLPLQLPTVTLVHLPMPAGPRNVEIRERGCGCLLWSARPGERALRSEMLLQQGIVSVELAKSPAAAYSRAAADTVIVGLMAGSFTFDVSVEVAETE